jgi:hypothetical protein
MKIYLVPGHRRRAIRAISRLSASGESTQIGSQEGPEIQQVSSRRMACVNRRKRKYNRKEIYCWATIQISSYRSRSREEGEVEVLEWVEAG